MSNICIETNQLTKRYGNKTAVNELNLTIKKGGIHAIVGSNGAGKSTLFRLLLGVATPSSGHAQILDQNSQNLSSDTRGKVGYVNEEHTLPNWMTVEKVVAMQKHFYSKWNEDTYQKVIGFFDVDLQQKVSGLSRGERAGFNLSMALAQSPEILILDEPTVGVDVGAKAEIYATIRKLRDTGTAVIVVSSDLEEVMTLADRILVFNKGRITSTFDGGEVDNDTLIQAIGGEEVA